MCESKTIGVMSLFYLDKLNLGTLGSEILLQQNKKRREAEGKNVTLKVAEVSNFSVTFCFLVFLRFGRCLWEVAAAATAAVTLMTMSREGQGRTRICLPYPPAAITSSSRAGRDGCRESSNDDEPEDEAPLLSLLPLFSTSNKNLEAKAPDFKLPHPPPLRPSRPPHLSDHELSDGFLDEIVDSLAARGSDSDDEGDDDEGQEWEEESGPFDPKTYISAPCQPEYAAFRANFKAEEKTAEIAGLLQAVPALNLIHQELVPEQVPYKEFWSRFFFQAAACSIAADGECKIRVVTGSDEADTCGICLEPAGSNGLGFADFDEHPLRCQNLYLCTSRASTLSSDEASPRA